MRNRQKQGWLVLLVSLGLAIGSSQMQAAASALGNMTPERAAAAQGEAAGRILLNLTSPLKNMTPIPAEADVYANAVPVGRVVWVKGTFTATLKEDKTNKVRVLQKASLIYLHDTLKTDENTQAQIVFSDNTLMTFRPKSTFIIDQYEYRPKEKQKSVGQYITNLLEGGFRTITGLIAKANPSDYKVNTPVATIGVRGTDYTLVLREKQLYLGRLKGSPCVNTERKTLCLDVKNRYGYVPEVGGVPATLTKPPAFLLEKIQIVPVTVEQMGGIGGATSGGKTTQTGAVSTTGGTSSGGTAGTTIAPVTNAIPSSGTVSSFCIQ